MIFRWARDQLGTSEIELAKRLGKDPYEVLTEIAAKVNPGSDGLLFHPYLAGKELRYGMQMREDLSSDLGYIIKRTSYPCCFRRGNL